MGREEQEAARFEEVTRRLQAANIEVGRTRGTFDPVIEAIPTLGTLAVLAVGTQQVANGSLEPAAVVQVAYLISVLAFPVRALGWVLGELPRTVVGWDRVDAVLKARGELEFGSRDLPALGRVDAAARRGRLLLRGRRRGRARSRRFQAIHGVTHRGARGVDDGPRRPDRLRQVDPDQPHPAAGRPRPRRRHPRRARPARGRPRRRRRRSATLVPQQTFLFDDTVRGNVTLGADFTDERGLGTPSRSPRRPASSASCPARSRHPGRGAWHLASPAASASGSRWPAPSSAGPSCSCLDDATSAVDPAVELAILTGLRESSNGMTVLVVAYRMSTITLADDIVYVEARPRRRPRHARRSCASGARATSGSSRHTPARPPSGPRSRPTRRSGDPVSTVDRVDLQPRHVGHPAPRPRPVARAAPRARA